MVATYAYGHDFGNAETGGVLFAKGQRFSMSLPSATAPGSLERLQRLGVNLADHECVLRMEDGTEYYVGRLAYTQSRAASTGRDDMHRYWSKRSLHLLLTTASLLLPDEHFALNVVTGLPVQMYLNDTESRKRIKQGLEGVHTFWVNDRKRTIEVTVDRVIMEGAGAIIAYGMKGNIKQGVIDIGGRTTDLFASHGQTPVSTLCSGKNLGVEMAFDAVSTAFQRLYGRPLQDEERHALQYAYPPQSPHRYPEIYANRKPVTELRALVQQAVESVGAEIASFIAQIWNEAEQSGSVASSFARVLLVGGGAYFFQEQIQAIIPEIQVAPKPEEANALGYAALAETLLKHRQSLRMVV